MAYFADYPLAPSREVIGTDKLSNEQIQMLGEMGVTSLPKVPKLVQTLDPKEGYVLHYLTLKLYIELGLRVTKLIKVFEFRQGRWIEPFHDLNTQLRMSARNKFEKKFHKLIVNSAFGKTMESKLGRKKLEIIRNGRELLSKNSFEHDEKLLDNRRGSCYCLFRCNEYFVGQTHDNWCKYFGFVKKIHVLLSLSANESKHEP